MRYVKIATNKVYAIQDIRNENPGISISEGSDLTHLGYAQYIETPYPQTSGWVDIAEGAPVNNTQVWVMTPQSRDKVIRRVSITLKQRMDEFAATRGYDNMLTACTYATSTNPVYAAEGARCVAVRDEQWAFLYSMFDKIDSGAIELPSDIYAFMAHFPEMTW